MNAEHLLTNTSGIQTTPKGGNFGLDAEALCPSFDHAASLGFTLTETVRAQHLREGTIADWANHGNARRFEHRRGTRWQTLVDLAGAAIALCEPNTRDYWRERILSVESDSVVDLVSRY